MLATEAALAAAAKLHELTDIAPGEGWRETRAGALRDPLRRRLHAIGDRVVNGRALSLHSPA